ncbi:pseudouridine-5'-phosphate glycosidase [Streptobacillus moniliformis]|uniref:Pseudouridine-5'-phosphate glycosidase n=1 Tax=Streptobacillus moniliformis (strain ATCC 14647 / DSM 12112 / NCTC 10651 / 9901) TaxID=519441 RepID=D1AXK7_STRM9|nr:pseudouridine-5'-phosphate glycosidase [Streptobacillus moniliformis]ACZ01033.1 Indigoidine synthase A family protein [Streptobacillus moniliformis DSM 12112]AVL42597.1 pseudouridine-5'-phosphate glycosidase [Streptobacillus moniliformis]QXW65814.1 pseudouridine-5'-phosphate glycosidase [Streptobacillus moniliformis]SQA13828.1 Pseudouridine-5'-phosphate glycosidase [Streptobacillus moniliformis]
MKKYLEINPIIKEALENNKPVVALESTIISHGMPYPQNVEVALEVEKIARENGIVPATIGIINGKLKVGLTEDEINFLGKEGVNVPKVSRRDLAYIVSNGLNGATTVSTTMIIAALAGIKIFATGGIGGVHRNAEVTMDISADLEELAQTNVAVICAGAKSILDLPLTLEYLETKGVPVLGYKTKELPAFYTIKSGYNLDYSIDNPKEFAKILKTKWNLGLNGGVVIANPIPEQYAMDFDTITNAINNALEEAEKLGIKGKDSTPFLLDKVKKITDGKSLDANIQLVYNNVRLAAEIAKEFVQL